MGLSITEPMQTHLDKDNTGKQLPLTLDNTVYSHQVNVGIVACRDLCQLIL